MGRLIYIWAGLSITVPAFIIAGIVVGAIFGINYLNVYVLPTWAGLLLSFSALFVGFTLAAAGLIYWAAQLHKEWKSR